MQGFPSYSSTPSLGDTIKLWKYIFNSEYKKTNDKYLIILFEISKVLIVLFLLSVFMYGTITHLHIF